MSGSRLTPCHREGKCRRNAPLMPEGGREGGRKGGGGGGRMGTSGS